MAWKIQTLPYPIEPETKTVLKNLVEAHKALAELKGVAYLIPNQSILISTLFLKEAKNSSEVENIVTTQDELYKGNLMHEKHVSPATKEVQNYVKALSKGYELVKEHKLLSANHIIEIQQILEQNKAGFRKVTGTSLVNPQTKQVVYTPPQHPSEIVELMDNLVNFINDNTLANYDPLTKMAIIHFQFESIHPFYDGNGRTGRIINILYLVLQELLDIPILYLSRYIIKNKQKYYAYLQEVRDKNHWENWINFVITGINETALETSQQVKEIKKLMDSFKKTLKADYKFYSHDLINHLFKHPYTKIELLMEELSVSRVTASSYLNQIATGGLIEKVKMGRSYYFVNLKLVSLLAD